MYTEQDSGIAPPTMVRPQLPSTPRADSAPSDSYIEVVVDEDGLVQQVRLRSSEPTLNDRMIVAAAKAWQFEPARKDGVPVKYVLRIPVTR
jgi:iron complex outermembrane recepter protein